MNFFSVRCTYYGLKWPITGKSILMLLKWKVSNKLVLIIDGISQSKFTIHMYSMLFLWFDAFSCPVLCCSEPQKHQYTHQKPQTRTPFNNTYILLSDPFLSIWIIKIIFNIRNPYNPVYIFGYKHYFIYFDAKWVCSMGSRRFCTVCSAYDPLIWTNL